MKKLKPTFEPGQRTLIFDDLKEAAGDFEAIRQYPERVLE